MSGSPLRVAVLGAGTVGREVVRGLLDGAGQDTTAGERRLELAGVAVRDVAGAIARGIPAALLTDAPAHLVAAPDTDVIVEVMGGDEPAGTLVLAALSAGKAVVTANKHLLAHRGPELEAVARRTRAPLRFEAAVGGGIPVLWPLAADLAASRVERIRGIVNGTTNYILSAMAAGEGTYEAILADAQAKGYAEADPSGDVEGRDAVNKLVILARLAFGGWLDPALVVDCPSAIGSNARPGIVGVSTAELVAARELGLTIKLVATATAGPVTAAAVPTAVPLDGSLGGTGGVRNRIEVTTEAHGVVGFDGPGAGGAPTAGAVLADVRAVARDGSSTWAGLPPPTEVAVQPSSDATGPWFAFLPGGNRDGVDGLAVEAVETAGGVGFRTGPVRREDVARRLRDVDAPLYRIDD